MNKNDLSELTNSARTAVQRASDFIRGEAGKVQSGQVEEKFMNGLVSYVDRTAEEMLVEDLGKLIPEAAFLTEEETVEQSNAAYQWIIDPLDGTTNFLYNLPHYSVSVGLRAGDDLLIGIVHHVPLDEQYYAHKGGGAFLDGKPIRVSSRTNMREALVATGFPYHAFDRAEGWFDALKFFMQSARGVRRFGSAALDLAYVAAGHYDIFFEYGLNAWDIAGGAVLITEAGGRIGDFGNGKNFLFDGEILTAAPGVFEEAQAMLKEKFAA